MTVDLAAITAVCCLGIGACGYLIGRLHARARGCPHPHWDITREDLLDELQQITYELDRHDAAVVVNYERWFNRRETLLEHKQDVVAQLAELPS